VTRPINRDQFNSPSQRSERIHHLPRTQPASGLRRQPELCQQAAGVLIRMALQSAWFRGDMQGM
jgi:hypothetical protein